MGEAGMDRLWAFFADNSDAVQAVSSAVQAFFAVVLVLFTLVQLRVARVQTDIAEQTRKIAIAALGRPYVFLEFVSHNFEEWRTGKDWLYFNFRFTNQGTTPAVVEFVNAKTILSYGPINQDEDRGNLVKDGIVKPFPPKDGFRHHVSRDAIVHFAPTEKGGELQDWQSASTLVLKAGETSRQFQTMLPRPALGARPGIAASEDQILLHELTGEDGPIYPWLVGNITYRSPLGTQHYTSFCIYGRSNGSASEWPEEPYNERT